MISLIGGRIIRQLLSDSGGNLTLVQVAILERNLQLATVNSKRLLLTQFETWCLSEEIKKNFKHEN